MNNKDRCNIYCDSNGQWKIQVGYNVVGRYASLKGARIAASKLGLSYPKDKKVA